MQERDHWPPGGLTWSEAAALLDTTPEDVFDQVVLGRIRTVPSPSGRPLVTREAVEERLRERAGSGA